jgi:hypothetical protein
MIESSDRRLFLDERYGNNLENFTELFGAKVYRVSVSGKTPVSLRTFAERLCDSHLEPDRIRCKIIEKIH